MKSLKIILFTLFLFLPSITINLNPALAEASAFKTSLDTTAKGTGHSQMTVAQKDLSTIIGTVIGVLLGIIGVYFLGLLIYGGYTWMMARGNEQEITKAQDIIKHAIIGLIIVLGAYAITAFVGRAVSIQSYSQCVASAEEDGADPITVCGETPR